MEIISIEEYLVLIVAITCVVFQFPTCLLYMNVTINSHLHTKTKRRKTSIKVYFASKREAAAPSNSSICRHRTSWSVHFNPNRTVSALHKPQKHGHDNRGHKTPASSHDREGHHGGTSALETRFAVSQRMNFVWQQLLEIYGNIV